MPDEQTEVRPLYRIARDISTNWENMSYAAKPYYEAMLQINKITDMYYHDRASDVVRYFLSNAGTWRGPDARRIKQELNDMLKGVE